MNEWLDSTVLAYKKYFKGSKSPVVWDVGSRDGRDGVEIAERILLGAQHETPIKATVVCVEPNPPQAELIRVTYPWVTVHELAASDTTGVADFMVYEGDEGAVGSSSLNLGWKEDDLPGHIITVQKVRLDQILPECEIDIMKIDVEGHSLQVLKGLGDRLRDVRVYHVETEEWSGSDKKVESFMNAAGFKLEKTEYEWGGIQDQVWVNTSLVPVRAS